jgi:hypothetical protein
MLLLVGQDVFYLEDYAPTDFKKKRPPANGPPTHQRPFGKVPVVTFAEMRSVGGYAD